MTKKRLNKTHKDTILDRALKFAFEERKSQIATKYRDLADDIYADLYPIDLQAKMNELPAGAFFETSHLRCKFGDEYEHLALTMEKKIMAKHKGYYTVFSDDHHFTARVYLIRREEKQLNEEKNTARISIQAVLDSVRNFEQLLQVWPECETFTKDLVESEKVYLPAVCVDDINKLLGLPPAQPQEAAS